MVNRLKLTATNTELYEVYVLMGNSNDMELKFSYSNGMTTSILEANCNLK